MSFLEGLGEIADKNPRLRDRRRANKHWKQIINKYLQQVSTEELLNDCRKIGITVNEQDEYDRQELESQLKWIILQMDAAEEGISMEIYPV